jgi:hypothetical protein
MIDIKTKIAQLETKKIELEDRMRAVDNEHATKLRNYDGIANELSKVN